MRYPRVWSVARFLLIGMTGAAAGGCASLSRVRFTVEESSLDYVHFRQTEIVDGDKAPIVKALELNGSGYLEYRTGRSERVRDGFWQESTSPHLEDLHTDRLVLSQEETVAFYQRLVDAGIFDGIQKEKATEGAPKILVYARIAFEKRVIITTNPVYAEIFDELLSRFQR